MTSPWAQSSLFRIPLRRNLIKFEAFQKKKKNVTDAALEGLAAISVLYPSNTRPLDSLFDVDLFQVKVTTYDDLSIARHREKRLPVLVVKPTTIHLDRR